MGEARTVIELYEGPRAALRALFELAEDSATELDSYLDLDRVLVARNGKQVVGHLQLTETGGPDQLEIKNMAVLAGRRRRGLGRRLVEAAVELAAAEGRRLLIVATASADIDNLRFYQRCGFRICSVERDAFTPANGYAEDVLVNGIELRDRVWLDMSVGSEV